MVYAIFASLTTTGLRDKGRMYKWQFNYEMS